MARSWDIECRRSEQAEPITVVLFGLGPIGVLAGKLVHAKDRLRIVGAIDIDPAKVGKDVGDLLGVDPLGVVVSDRATDTLSQLKPDVVVQTTCSHMPDVRSQIVDILSCGANIVSSTEELLYPYLQAPAIAEEIDAVAKKHKVSVLGTGVNPGFVMDTLALLTTFACRDVRAVKVTRIVDASTRRGPLQKKVGAAMDPEEFRRLVEEGKMGHVGLVESIAIIADALGWELDRIEEQIAPLVAEEPIKTDYFEIAPGQVKGIHQTGGGYVGGDKLIDMELQMFMHPDEPGDRIRITGDPGMDVRIAGGTPGDIATPAALVNAIPRVLQAPAGLVTMKDIALPSCLMAPPVRIVGKS